MTASPIFINRIGRLFKCLRGRYYLLISKNTELFIASFKDDAATIPRRGFQRLSNCQGVDVLDDAVHSWYPVATCFLVPTT